MTRRLLLGALVVAAVAIGVWLYARPRPTVRAARSGPPLADLAPPIRLVSTLPTLPSLGTPATFDPVNRTLFLEISEYAGYSGLIVANGGLDGAEDSIFFKRGGFKVRVSLREQESWGAIAEGKIAAAPTTADSVTLWGAQLKSVVPLLVSYSRGADGVVTRDGIDTMQGLKGKIVATAQFTEAEFFMRDLARRSGLGITRLQSPDSPPDPQTINLVFAADGFAACDLLLNELIYNRPRIAGCAAWEPKLSEVVRRSGGSAHFLTTNRNLLTIADVLLVNGGLATEHPEVVDDFVQGILIGNQMVLNNPENQLTTIGRVFGWTRDKVRQELRQVHLANLPENIDFFTGTATDVGSFAYIYNRALEAYGDVLDNAAPMKTLFDLQYLRPLQQDWTFADQRASVVRLRPLVPEASPQDVMPEPRVVPEASEPMPVQ